MFFKPGHNCPEEGPGNVPAGVLSHREDRWTLHLLQRSGPERRSHHPFAARPSIVFEDVSAFADGLADSYHLVAPDYPGYGHSDWPDPKQFDYTFDHIASVMDGFTATLGLSGYTLYMQDYGVPVGFRMALAHPERVQALIVQDGVAHNEGLGANWTTRRAFWADRPAYEEALRKNLLSLATTKTRHMEMIRMSSSMTPIFGAMNSPF